MSRIASEGPVLRQWDAQINGTVVHVMKLPDDPICLRASLGGNHIDGYYLTYRGDDAQIARLLEGCLAAFWEGRP